MRPGLALIQATGSSPASDLPRHHAFAEQRAIALLLGCRARTPLLQMEAVDAAGIGVDPGHRVFAGFRSATAPRLRRTACDSPSPRLPCPDPTPSDGGC